jgi:hypothetical protein
MHEGRGMSCVVWRDKCPILLIFTHEKPIGFLHILIDEVSQRNIPIREKISTLPMLVKVVILDVLNGWDKKTDMSIYPLSFGLI